MHAPPAFVREFSSGDEEDKRYKPRVESASKKRAEPSTPGMFSCSHFKRVKGCYSFDKQGQRVLVRNGVLYIR